MCNPAVEYNVAVFSEILGCLIIWSDFRSKYQQAVWVFLCGPSHVQYYGMLFVSKFLQ